MLTIFQSTQPSSVQHIEKPASRRRGRVAGTWRTVALFGSVLLTAAAVIHSALMAQEAEKKAEKAIEPAAVTLGRPIDFEKDVYPILDQKCIACHNVAIAENGLIMEDVKAMLKGGKRGPGIVAKEPDKSPIYLLAARAQQPVMPPLPNKVEATALTPQELGILRQWILEGASAGTGTGGRMINWQPLPKGVQPVYAVAITGDGQYVAAGRGNGISLYNVPSGDLVAQLSDPALKKYEYMGKPMYSPTAAHRDYVHSLAISPNGRLIASGSYREIKLWGRPDAAAQFSLAASTGPVTSSTISPDGKLIATGSADNTIKLFNAADGQAVRVLTGHTGPATKLQFSNDGTKLVSGSADQSIRLWQVADGALLGRIDTPAPVTSLTLSIDQTKVISGHADKLIRVWELPSGAASFPAPAAAVPSIAVSPDKKWMALANADGSISLFDLATRQIAKQLAGHTGAVNAVKFSANSARLISGGVDKTVRVWDVATGQAAAVITGTVQPVGAVAISPNGLQAVAGAADGQTSIFKLDAPAARPYPSDNGAAATVVAISRDGKQSASDGVVDGKPVIIVRDIASGNMIKTLVGHEAAVTSLSFSPDGTRLVSGSADKTARVWQIGEAKELQKFTGHTNTVTAVVYTNNADQVCSGSADNSLKLWNVGDGKEAANFAGHTGAISSLAYSTGAGQLISGSADQTVRIWNAGNGQQAAAITHGQPVSAVAVTADSQKIAVSGADQVVKVYQPNGQAQFTLTGHGAAVKMLAISPDNLRLAAGGADNLVTMWDLQTGLLLETLPVPAGLTSVQFAGAPLAVLVGSADKVQAVHTLKFERSLPGHAKAVTALAYNPQGDAVYSTSEDGHVRRFAVANGQQQWAQNVGAPIHDLAQSADGQWLATAAENNQTRIWNAANGGGGPQAVLQGFTAAVRSVTFLGDNEHVASGTVNNLVYVHNIKTGAVTQIFAEHTGAVDALAAAGEKGKLVISTGADKQLRAWPVVSGLIIAGSNTPITGVAIVPPQGQFLFASSEDGTLRVIDLNNGNAVRGMNHGGAVTGIAVRPDGQRLASAGANNAAKLWDFNNGQQLAELKGDLRAQQLVARLTADDNEAKGLVQVAMAAIPTAEKTLGERNEGLKKANEVKAAAEKTANEAAEKMKQTAEAAANAKKAADDKKDDANLQKAAADAQKAASDAEAAAKKANEEKTRAADGVVQAEKDVQLATAAVAKAKADHEAIVNRQKSIEAALGMAKTASTDKEKPIKTVAFSLDGKELAAAGDTGYISRYDGTTGVPLETIDGHTGPVLSLSYSPTRQLLSAGADQSAKLWTVHPNWTLVGVLGPKKEAPEDLADSVLIDRVVSLAFSPDGTLLASGGGDPSRSGEVILWDVANRAVSKTIADAHSDTVLGMEFSRDGLYLLTGAADKFVKIFEVASGKHVKSFEGHTNHVLDVSWRSDGKRIVSAGADNAIKVWNVELGEQERTIQGYSKQVTSIQYVGRANNVISCGGDKTVRFHAADNGGNFRNFGGATDFLYSVAASENEQLIVAGGQDGVVRVWNAQNAQQVRQFDPPKEEAAVPAQQAAAK